MKLLFQEQTIEMEQNQNTDTIITKINELLGDDFYFSHLIVDGVEVNEDPEAFLTEQFGRIQQIEVVAIPAKEFVNDLLLSTEDYVSRALPYIVDVADSFAQGESEEQWTDLANLLEGIQWMTSMAATIEESIARPTAWAGVTEQMTILENSLPQLEEALVNQDQAAISKVLTATVKVVFERLGVRVKEIVDQEGQRDLLN